MSKIEDISIFEARAGELEGWIDEQAPYARFDQRHLDVNTPEQAYWHLGYQSALKDVVAHLKEKTANSEDSATGFPPVELGD